MTTGGPSQALPDDGPATTTPIKHVVVIVGEDRSYDHYFGTYPNAANNNAGEPGFTAAAGTPASDNYVAHPNLLTTNPNANQPARLARTQAVTCDPNSGYTAGQLAFDGGLMDKFVQNTSCGGSTSMNYYDGNTVTGLWNLAQHFSMSDAFHQSTFGPSTPGALNLVSGQTHGANANAENGTIIAAPDPVDDCGNHANTVMSGQNVGDLLNAHNVTWGWFQGGFRPSSVSAGIATCATSHQNVGGATITDYRANREPFQYYASTGNPHHTAPASTAEIGHAGPANHQYDVADFDAALAAGNLPQVSFLKAAAYEDGHPASSDPLDEQQFLVHVLNELQDSPEWASTAVLLTWAGSGGWYDHAFAAITNSSAAASDALNSPGVCGATAILGGFQDRCGPGPRTPFVVVSPWVVPNTINHTPGDPASILRFIEDNWSLGQIGASSFDTGAATLSSMFDFNPAHPRAPKVILDPSTGNVVRVGDPLVFEPAFVCKGKRKGAKTTLTCTESGITTVGTITVKAKLLKGKKKVAKGKGTVANGALKIKLKASKQHPVTKGKYKLELTVTQGTNTRKLTVKLKLK